MDSSYKSLAGSGPSTEGFEGRVDVATKKRDVDSDYIFVPHIHFWHTFRAKERNKPLLVSKRKCTCKKCRDCDAPIDFAMDWDRWMDYYAGFNPKNRKPSTGTQAVFCVVERWAPDTVGLIGYDWILDGNDAWFHDADAERRAIEGLVDIKDLRDRRTDSPA